MFKKSTGKGISIPAGIGFGVLFSIVITIAGAAVIAYLLNSERMSISGIGWGAIVILAIASFTGGVLASRLVKVNRLPVCMGVGVGYLLSLIACTALFFGGQYQGIIATAITVLLSSAGAGIIGLKGKKSPFQKKKILAYR